MPQMQFLFTEKRKQILFGVTVFLLFHVFNFPWPFYDGPLDYIAEGTFYLARGLHWLDEQLPKQNLFHFRKMEKIRVKSVDVFCRISGVRQAYGFHFQYM
ncbi:hypothetical protein OSTOST_17311 [Ostertagia ostertagi]